LFYADEVMYRGNTEFSVISWHTGDLVTLNVSSPFFISSAPIAAAGVLSFSRLQLSRQ